MKKKDIHVWRRTLQAGVAVLFILLPLLNAGGFNFIWGNFLNIHVGSFIFSDPLAVLQGIVRNRYFPVGLLISGGTVLAIAFFLGSVFCAWICPFGLLSELINRIAFRFRQKKVNAMKTGQSGFFVKLVVFCTSLLAVNIFFNSSALNLVSMPFQYSNIFQYFFNQNHLSAAIFFVGIILLAEFLFTTRFWCRWVCPQSVLLAVAKLFNPFRLKLAFEQKKCMGHKAPFPCRKACSLDLDPRRLTLGSQAQCTNCGDCVDACRKTGSALGFRFYPG